MNNSNPFVPQGSLLEQKNKKRARVKVAVFSIFALNILVILPLLIQGCSKKDANADSGNTASATPPADTGAPVDTNPQPPLPPIASNTPPVVTNTVVTPPPAAAQPPVAAPDVPTTKEYVVAKGDTYYSIGKKFDVRMKDIQTANPNVNPAKLKVGQKLEIPAAGSSSGIGMNSTGGADGSETVYVVKSGDSLTKIAKANGVSVKALKAANDLKTDRIKAGQKLKLPTKAAAPVDTTTPPTTTTSAVSTAPAPTAGTTGR